MIYGTALTVQTATRSANAMIASSSARQPRAAAPSAPIAVAAGTSIEKQRVPGPLECLQQVALALCRCKAPPTEYELKMAAVIAAGEAEAAAWAAVKEEAAASLRRAISAAEAAERQSSRVWDGVGNVEPLASSAASSGPARPILELQLLDHVPFAGAVVFDRARRLSVDLTAEAKSFGTRYTGCQLDFTPDGTVCGKFVKLVAYRAPHGRPLEGGRGHGDGAEGERSCFRGLYLVTPSGGVVIFACTDCECDVLAADGTPDVSFDDTPFDNQFMRDLGLTLPLPTLPPSEPDVAEFVVVRVQDEESGEWSSRLLRISQADGDDDDSAEMGWCTPPARCILGAGDELERLQAAHMMMRMGGLQTLCETGEVPGELRPKVVEQMRDWSTSSAWACPGCGAGNGDLTSLACSRCNHSRCPVSLPGSMPGSASGQDDPLGLEVGGQHMC